jgi:hypothetical protein
MTIICQIYADHTGVEGRLDPVPPPIKPPQDLPDANKRKAEEDRAPSAPSVMVHNIPSATQQNGPEQYVPTLYSSSC